MAEKTECVVARLAQKHESEMLGNSSVDHSPDSMAGVVLRACVMDSKGLYDKMQHIVITPKGDERRVDVECVWL